jgi:hypothetical protein
MRYNPSDGRTNFMRPRLALLCALALLPVAAGAAALDARDASRISDSALGVDFAGLEDAAASTRTAALVEAYASAGVKWARVRARWARVETSTGVYDDAALDALTQALFDRGAKVLLTLDGAGQKLYANGDAPTAANGALEPWRDWAAHEAERYKSTVSAWQAWEEPARAWSPEKSAADYAALLAATTDAIQAARPGAFVVLGGVPAGDADFLRAVLAKAAGRVDAVDLRLGADAEPDELARACAATRAVLDAAPLPRPVLWLGADAPPDAADAPPAADAAPEAEPAPVPSAAVAAKRLARVQIAALACGAARRFMAPPRDAGTGAAELAVLRVLALLFDDRVTPSPGLHAGFQGAPKGTSASPFETASGAPLLAFWSGGDVSEDEPGRPCVLTASQPLRDPVLVDALDGEVRPLGSGSLTMLTVPVRDYPMFVTPAAVLKEAAAALFVAEETYAEPRSVRGGQPVTLRYSLTAPAPITIELFTSRHELLRVERRDAAAGRGSWEWTADVGAGTYYWRVSARGQSLVGKFAVLR